MGVAARGRCPVPFGRFSRCHIHSFPARIHRRSTPPPAPASETGARAQYANSWEQSQKEPLSKQQGRRTREGAPPSMASPPVAVRPCAAASASICCRCRRAPRLRRGPPHRRTRLTAAPVTPRLTRTDGAETPPLHTQRWNRDATWYRHHSTDRGERGEPPPATRHASRPRTAPAPVALSPPACPPTHPVRGRAPGHAQGHHQRAGC